MIKTIAICDNCQQQCKKYNEIQVRTYPTGYINGCLTFYYHVCTECIEDKVHSKEGFWTKLIKLEFFNKKFRRPYLGEKIVTEDSKCR